MHPFERIRQAANYDDNAYVSHIEQILSEYVTIFSITDIAELYISLDQHNEDVTLKILGYMNMHQLMHPDDYLYPIYMFRYFNIKTLNYVEELNEIVNDAWDTDSQIVRLSVSIEPSADVIDKK